MRNSVLVYLKNDQNGLTILSTTPASYVDQINPGSDPRRWLYIASASPRQQIVDAINYRIQVLQEQLPGAASPFTILAYSPTQFANNAPDFSSYGGFRSASDNVRPNRYKYKQRDDI